MPNLIELKANFGKGSVSKRPGAPELPARASVSIEHLVVLCQQIKSVKKYWDNIKKKHKSLPRRIIIEAHYNKTIAKSRRISKLLIFPNGNPVEEDIVGARFGKSDNCHIISYALPYALLDETIEHIQNCINYMKVRDVSEFTTESLEKFNKSSTNTARTILKRYSLTKNGLARTVVDAYYVRKFSPPEEFVVSNEAKIITLFEIDEIDKLLKLAGLNDEPLNIMKNSMLLSDKQQSILYSNAPYLVSMSVSDFMNAPEAIGMEAGDEFFSIPSPGNEPTIGVIDTQFKKSVYFHEWVEYVDVLNGVVSYNDEDYVHGTAVSSIIVDGPAYNRHLEDNCGRFKVKHFGVGTKNNISIYTIANEIENWVKQNPDIHVWNMSLGSEKEVEKSSISFLASVLDDIQSRYNVIFVVAGTNDGEATLSKKIGSPADSINSLIVNSVNARKEKASYSRKGPVLSFFMKPDICAFGGDKDDEMVVYGFVGTRHTYGTSFAAPWIARKLAFLIDKMGISIPVAKALIIDSAVTWGDDLAKQEHSYYGYGVVPTKIEDILTSKKDEIKFFINTTISSSLTYLYDIPVPVIKNRFPFIAKATLCYMSNCSRNYGVDYTDTELDFKFGRIKNKSSGNIDSINDDTQYDSAHFTLEEDSRKNFRKWDNVKNIVQKFTNRLRDKSRFSDNLWGIKIRMVNRNSSTKQTNINAGIVITLKELHGVNRFDSFVQYCRLNHFIVNEINITNRIELDNMLRQEVDIVS